MLVGESSEDFQDSEFTFSFHNLYNKAGLVVYRIKTEENYDSVIALLQNGRQYSIAVANTRKQTGYRINWLLLLHDNINNKLTIICMFKIWLGW